MSSGPGYSRHPNHRVAVSPVDESVRVSLGGLAIAESTRALRLTESRYEDTFYIPRDDLALELVASDTSTYCPFKGTASYWTLDAAGERVEDIAWSYEDPYNEVAAIAGCLAFYASKVDVRTDS